MNWSEGRGLGKGLSSSVWFGAQGHFLESGSVLGLSPKEGVDTRSKDRCQRCRSHGLCSRTTDGEGGGWT